MRLTNYYGVKPTTIFLICETCKQRKSEDHYERRIRNKSGRSGSCKVCLNKNRKPDRVYSKHFELHCQRYET